MKKNIWFPALLTLTFFAFAAYGSATADNHKKLKTVDGSFEAALEYAAETQKPVFVMAHAEWCGACRRLERNTLSDGEVIGFMNANFVNFDFDIEKGEGPELVEKFNIQRTPSLLFITPDGEVFHSFTGYKNARNFLSEADEAAKKFEN